MKSIQHGDISIHPIKELPKGLKKVEFKDTFVLAHGESTGHQHRVIGGEFDIYQSETGEYYIQVKKPNC